jgi:hypothetical protein
MSQLYALVPIPALKDAPDNAVMVGTLEACVTGLEGTPSHQELLDLQAAIPPLLQQVKQFGADKEAFYGTLQQTIDACDRQNARLDSFEKQRAISAKRAEAEQKRRERQRVQAYIDGLPDPDAPEPLLLPVGKLLSAALPGKEDDGELTIHHKVDPAERGYDPDDPEIWEEDDVGLEGSVTTRPTTDPKDLGYPPPPRQVPQPVSVSLNSNSNKE